MEVSMTLEIEGEQTSKKEILRNQTTGSFEIKKGNKTIKITLLDHDIKRLRPQCELDSVFYVRVDLPVKKITESKDESEIEYSLEPYFITSNRELLYAEDPTLKQKFQLPLMVKADLAKWNTNDLLEFIEKKESSVNIQDVYSSTELIIRKYLDLPSDGYYAVISLWIIGTYVSRLFAYFPYLDFNGTKGSAKTKSVSVVTQLNFAGEMLNDISPSAAHRSIESTGCSLGIDESEYLKDPKSEKSQLILSLLKGAFKTDAKIKISITKNGDWVPWSFDAGSCIALGHINGLDNVLEDRTIPIPMIITSDKKIAGMEIDPNDPIWEIQRAKYYRLVLIYFNEIKELKEISYTKNIITNRELNQIWKPVLTLARFFEKNGIENLTSRLDEVINQSHESKVLSNQTSNIDIQILEGLVSLIVEKKLTQIDDLKKANWYRQQLIFTELRGLEGLEWISSTQTIGNSLNRLGFKRKKHRIGQIVYIERKSLIDTCKRHFVNYEDLPGSEENSSQPSQQEGKIDSCRDESGKSDDKTGLGDIRSYEEIIKEQAQKNIICDENDANDKRLI